MDSRTQLLYQMCKHQSLFAKIYHEEQIEKRKVYNKNYLSKNYYANSKEYRREYAKYGAKYN